MSVSSRVLFQFIEFDTSVDFRIRGVLFVVLSLKGVFECEGYNKDFSYDFDMSDYEESEDKFPFKDPVHVEINLKNRAGVVGLHVSAESVYSTVCDRCCEPLKEQLNVVFDNVLVREISNEDGDNTDLIKVEGDSFSVDELVRSNIILNIPMKHLCKEDCKGLCPICGQNLNKGTCSCVKENNSPFNVLKDLIK